MNEDTSLFSLSKISINDLFILREKKYNKPNNTKYIRGLPIYEDDMYRRFEKSVENEKINLGINSRNDNISNYSPYLKPACSKNNRKFRSTEIATENKSIQSNGISISEQKYGERDKMVVGSNIIHSICGIKLDNSPSVIRKRLHTKGIWDSIQENINIISSGESV
ncbi:hypothetical protein OIY81_728 [Cryptosporidium canis]|uniref:Uncharacterized protein n=1 Tax=Cryptosporidium canis TaxID=195482 RepID=A0ABQ8PBI8_9CRYT|nr:hypothetical protein OIY81_728 [Cryptosporidium canis]KAJ1615285.1 hypothetical protein OJ252_271 [Cryptosporidium canis]